MFLLHIIVCFKTRYDNHKLSFNDRKHSHATVLSKDIRELKDSNTSYNLQWHIIKRVNPYRGNPSCCKLCLPVSHKLPFFCPPMTHLC